ncbi:SIMPL domain-containing protein [Shewanella sedimentimangrovi]|uniref:SIMPL domain-containing protein n=1 Tax=Shewanella sedimentimangrovi TaxID=2814293 RepID=A0ABX7R1P8_9GAMM|nr:SIMPL domain-containing protein [Shewanella sedimentimangrovi]QSX37614.1 SIMPL domain-containing protein [Shewanella sedimentimangrovi]
MNFKPLLFVPLLMLSQPMLSQIANASELPAAAHLAVTGKGMVTAKPDSAEISLNVEVTEQEALKAKGRVDAVVNTLMSGLADYGIEGKDVTASQLNVEPETRYDDNNNRVILGHRASRRLEAVLKDPSKLSDFLDFALKAGITEIDGIQMRSSKAEALKLKAQSKAVRDAKTQAERLAAELGVKLGSIYSIIPESRNLSSRYSGIERIEVTGSRLSKPQYLQEEMEFSATVSLIFLLDLGDDR